jgi:hypothetical protein
MARPAARTRQASPAAAGRGPYQTERQAAGAAGATQAAAGVSVTAGNYQMLTQACAAARIQLGHWDRRVLAWLAGWEPATCAVIAGLICRAAAAPPRAASKEVPDGPARPR